MRKFFTIFFVVIVVGSFLGLGFYLFQKSQKPPVVYELDSAFYADIVYKTVAAGSIVPRKEIAVKSQVSGVIEELYVEAGQIVEEGALIAKVKIIPDVVQLNNAEQQVKQAMINFKNAEKELTRQKELFDQRVISEFDYNQFLLQYNLASQSLEAAENNLELIKEGASKKTGVSSNLVTATADGMVIDVPVKEGFFIIETNTFSEGTTIASIANMNEMIFEGKVDEAEVGKIKEGMELSLRIGALDQKTFDAILEYISPKGLEEEGAIQFQIRAAVQLDPNTFLRAGYSANADIVLDSREKVLAIKESNLIFEEDKQYVEVSLGENQFERREVKTGLSDGINIEILSGISEDTWIKEI